MCDLWYKTRINGEQRSPCVIRSSVVNYIYYIQGN